MKNEGGSLTKDAINMVATGQAMLSPKKNSGLDQKILKGERVVFFFFFFFFLGGGVGKVLRIVLRSNHRSGEASSACLQRKI